jgi:hypothetical protein
LEKEETSIFLVKDSNATIVVEDLCGIIFIIVLLEIDGISSLLLCCGVWQRWIELSNGVVPAFLNDIAI